jgi:integrase
MSALICNGSRVLTPSEASAIRSVISKPSSRALFDLLLYTGLRLSEVKQLANNPAIFDEQRKTITIASSKKESTQKTRNVHLCENGIMAVKAFIDNPKIPSSPSAWQMNLIRWCRAGRVEPLAGKDPLDTGNIFGITVRTTRKTLESWLLMSYPDRSVYIALSQGHTVLVQLQHYLNLSYTEDETNEIRGLVSG